MAQSSAPFTVSDIQCFLFFPALQLLLTVAANMMFFRVIPAAFVTTQVKEDLKSSDVTFFNSKLLCRIAPSSKVDLKQHNSSVIGWFQDDTSIITLSCFLTVELHTHCVSIIALQNHALLR